MSRLVLAAIGLSLILDLTGAERVRYDNYNIYQVIPRTLKDVQFLKKLETSSDSLIYLNSVTAVEKSVNILVAPHKQPDFVALLNDNELRYELAEENLQRSLDAEVAEAAVSSKADVYDWSGYHTLTENYDWLRSLAQKYPGRVEVVRGGSTYEGREILGVKVSFKAGNKGIFIEGGIHAREWISPATVTYILNQLLTSTDSAVRAMAERFDWYIFPHVNPDGYVYTHTANRLWRKNRARSNTCYGIDLNRNWDFHWMETGASDQECDETYAGTAPFSEIETRSLSEYLLSLKGKIHTYLSFHSYSQLFLFPYGHTIEHCKNHDDLQQIGEAAAVALAGRYGTEYRIGNTYDILYPMAASSVDWAYDKVDVPIAYIYELRPYLSSIGFILPSSEIIPTAVETLDSLVALIAEADKLGYYN